MNRFKKCDRIKDAVDVCVFLNQWDTAKALADQFEFKGVDTLFTKYASHLLEKGKITIAIDAYREAGQYLDAAKLLYGLAEDAAKTKLNPLRAKKLYVLAALQVEAYRDAKKAKNADPTRSAIDGMLAEDSTSQSQQVKNLVCSLPHFCCCSVSYSAPLTSWLFPLPFSFVLVLLALLHFSLFNNVSSVRATEPLAFSSNTAICTRTTR